jgi:hypothetical protein
MAVKTITTSYDSEVTLVITVIDDTSGDILDDTDGAFRSELTAALPTVALLEHTIANGFDTDILGRYERSENRIPWPDGNKTVLFRESGSSTVLLQQAMRTENDIEVEYALTGTLAAGVTVTVNPTQVGKGVLTQLVIKTSGATIKVKRGDVHYRGFNLGADFYKASAKYYFCAKLVQTDDNSTAIVNREMTVTDAANCSMNITFTSAELATVAIYFAEIERRDSDGTSNPRACWEGKLDISQDTRQ